MNTAELSSMSKQVRRDIINMTANAGSGHPGGSLSAADLMTCLFFNHMHVDPKHPDDPDRDRFVLSKGHAAPCYYAVLAEMGFISRDEFKNFRQLHSILQGHPDSKKVPGVDAATGSLGQGCSIAVGMALGGKLNHKDYRVYAVMGDGELDEGQVWEMALFANTKHLDNLIAFVDYNKLQIDGRTDNDDVCNLGDIAAKFASFGWYAQTVNGHEVAEINEAIENAKKNTGCPSVIVLDTIKGYGWSKTAGQVGSHSRGVSPEDLAEALAEIQAAMPPEGK